MLWILFVILLIIILATFVAIITFVVVNKLKEIITSFSQNSGNTDIKYKYKYNQHQIIEATENGENDNDETDASEEFEPAEEEEMVKRNKNKDHPKEEDNDISKDEDRAKKIIIVKEKKRKIKNHGDKDLYQKLYSLFQQQQQSISNILSAINSGNAANKNNNYSLNVVAADLPLSMTAAMPNLNVPNSRLMAIDEPLKGKIINSKLYNTVSAYNFTSKIVMEYDSFIEHDAIFSIEDENTLWSEVKFGIALILFEGVENVYNFRSNFSNDDKNLKILIEKTNLETVRLPVGKLKITFLLAKYISPYTLTMDQTEVYFFPQRSVDFLSR